MDKQKKIGKLYGIGVGPGDPELITVKAQRILRSVPIIAFPATDDGLSMARDIAAPHIQNNQKEIPIPISINKPGFPDRDLYDKAFKKLSREMDRGHDIAMLCEGDPFFYGSFSYIFLRITAHHYPVEVIPGISSPLAAACRLKRPIALREDRLSIIPASLPERSIIAMLNESEVTVFIKLGRHTRKIYDLLERLNLFENALYIEYATMTQEKIYPLDGIDPDTTPYFSIIIVERKGALWKETNLLPSLP